MTSSASAPTCLSAAYLEGTVDEAEHKLEAASAAYERALGIQPTAAEPLTALVRVTMARKQPEQALARLDQTIASQPDNVVAHNLKGELLTSRGQLEAAVAAFNSAIEKAPKWWMPYRGLAIAQLAGKHTDEAVAVLERGVQQTGAATLATDLASVYERLNRPDDAIRTYEGVVSRDPNSVAALNNLAMLLVSYRTDKASLDRAQQLTRAALARRRAGDPQYARLGEVQARGVPGVAAAAAGGCREVAEVAADALSPRHGAAADRRSRGGTSEPRGSGCLRDVPRRQRSPGGPRRNKTGRLKAATICNGTRALRAEGKLCLHDS